MRKKHSSQSSGRSLRTLGIFCLVVLVAISVSLGFRLFTLIKESKYVDNHTFTIGYIYKNDLDIIAVHPVQKKIIHLEVRGGKDQTERRLASGVLLDTVMTLSQPFKDNAKISHYFYDALWHRGGIKTELSSYDLVRLGITTSGISAESIEKQAIHIPVDSDSVDQIVSPLFADSAMETESKTIAIVNASGVSGLGIRLERVISNMGGSIISVTNGDAKDHSAMVFYGENTYTVKRLESVLKLNSTESTKQGLSDIIITIGKDKSTTTQF